MKVSRLPKDTGRSGWNAVLPEPASPTPLLGTVTADWLVIGAGVAGLAAARRLAQIRDGDRIAVLDAVRVGTGPAGRNSGFMIDLPHDLASENYGGGIERDRAQIAANRRAIAFAMEVGDQFGLGTEAISQTGKINAAASERGIAHNRNYADHLEALGEPFEALDSQQMRSLTGSSYYKGGLFTPGTAMVQPALFFRGVAAGLVSNRISIHEMSPVTGLTRTGSDWCATTPGGRVTAPRVILAVNGHVESFGQFRRRLVHVHLYASMTRALTREEIAAMGGEATWSLTPADPMGTTVRRINGIGGDRIVVRNRCDYTPGMETSTGRLEQVARDHDQSLCNRFPALAGVTMEYRWGGRLCMSLNDVPAWGEVDTGLFAACCQNGLGLARGTLSGMAAAEAAVGLQTENTRFLAANHPPRRLPPEPLAWLGATAKIRWGEIQAGPEL